MGSINVIPVLLGADINTYSVARAFHEAYGVTSVAVGTDVLGAVDNSKIIRFITEPRFHDREVFVSRLMSLADELVGQDAGRKLLLLGCNDTYVRMIIENRGTLEEQYILPYIDEALMNRLILKESFYELCDELHIDHPKTYLISKQDRLTKLGDVTFPVIVKPSNSVTYWDKRFEGMKKVYKAQSMEELTAIVDLVYSSHYQDALIMQDFIPGDDANMRVLTCYSERNGKVKMMCLGHVLLEEHTPGGLGNHAAILTEHDAPLMAKIKELLEKIGYVGFSNFDIKYDPRDGQYKVFELNVRQGRSNYYVTGAGCNIARLLVEDRVLEQDIPYTEVQNESFWAIIPKGVVYKYVPEKDLTDRVRACVKAGKSSSSLYYAYDMKGNWKRRFFLAAYGFNQRRKYHRYM